VRHTFELDFDLDFDALRSNGSLNVTRLFDVLVLGEGVFDFEELVESQGFPYNLRRLARFF